MKIKNGLCIFLIVQLHVKQPTVTNCITFNSIKTERNIIHPLKKNFFTKYIVLPKLSGRKLLSRHVLK